MTSIARTALAVILGLAACAGAHGQQTRIVTAENFNEYGLVYSLPTTAVSVEITARHTIRTAGSFHQYAKKYIGTSDVVSENSEFWEITDVRMSTYGVVEQGADIYRIQLKAGSPVFISVWDNGMIASVNKEDFINREQKVSDRNTGVGIKGIRTDEYLSYVDEDFLAAQSLAKRAQMLAENLQELREVRLGLTRGTAETVPTDGRQLEVMLSSLNQQEEILMRAFTGAEQTETVTRTFTFVPRENGREVLTRLSDFAGFVDSDDLRGAPVYITTEITREGEIPVDDKGQTKSMPKDAVVYCLPGAAEITVSCGGRKLAAEEFEFAQYGVKFGLNPALFTSKKDPAYAIFNSATGAVSEIGKVPVSK